MIDIHSHILPGVDDGAKDMDMSIEMAKDYLESGIRKVIASPHYIKDSYKQERAENQLVLESLREELARRQIPLEVYLGNEIYLSPETIDDIEEGRVASMSDSRYVLLELPMYDIPMYFKDIIYELQLRGYKAIIAHPERNKKIMDDPNLLYEFIENGSLAQMNLASLEGRYGESVRDTAGRLLDHKMIHFIGTDAHNTTSRSARAKKGLEILKELISEADYEKIIKINPGLLLEDKEIIVDQPLSYKKRKWFHFFKR